MNTKLLAASHKLSKLAIFTFAIFAVATAVTAVWSISTSYGGWRFGQDLMIAGIGIIVVGIIIPALEPRPDYTRNAYVTPGSHYMKVYPRTDSTPVVERGRSLAWKSRAKLSGIFRVTVAMVLAGLMMLAISILLS